LAAIGAGGSSSGPDWGPGPGAGSAPRGAAPATAAVVRAGGGGATADMTGSSSITPAAGGEGESGPDEFAGRDGVGSGMSSSLWGTGGAVGAGAGPAGIGPYRSPPGAMRPWGWVRAWTSARARMSTWV